MVPPLRLGAWRTVTARLVCTVCAVAADARQRMRTRELKIENGEWRMADGKLKGEFRNAAGDPPSSRLRRTGDERHCRVRFSPVLRDAPRQGGFDSALTSFTIRIPFETTIVNGPSPWGAREALRCDCENVRPSDCSTSVWQSIHPAGTWQEKFIHKAKRAPARLGAENAASREITLKRMADRLKTGT